MGFEKSNVPCPMHLERPVRDPAGFGDLHRLSRAQKGEYGAYGEIFEPATGTKRENRSGNGAFGRSGNEQTPGCRRAFLGEFSVISRYWSNKLLIFMCFSSRLTRPG